MDKSIKIKIDDWYDLHKPYTVTLNTGVTVLVGKNGSGKTTFLQQIQEYCKDNNYEFYYYSDVNSGRGNGLSEALFHNNIERLATLFMASEGQKVFENFSNCLPKVGIFVRKLKSDTPGFILLDAIDSGLSIDLLRELKDFFNEVLVPDCNHDNKEVYIIISTNQYEFTIGYPCIDVKTGKHITFKSYEDYVKFICKEEDE